ncbi:hypothetical protein EYD10_07992 [Varanus komodoensis]|nr:hypothetical protein EYD10_07992 [Varanus komodoensis]
MTIPWNTCVVAAVLLPLDLLVHGKAWSPKVGPASRGSAKQSLPPVQNKSFILADVRFGTGCMAGGKTGGDSSFPVVTVSSDPNFASPTSTYKKFGRFQVFPGDETERLLSLGPEMEILRTRNLEFLGHQIPFLHVAIVQSWNNCCLQRNTITQAATFHSDCFIRKEQEACLESIQKLTSLIPINESSPGCPGMWDNITCWKPAFVGEVIFVKCPALFTLLNFDDGNTARSFFAFSLHGC